MTNAGIIVQSVFTAVGRLTPAGYSTLSGQTEKFGIGNFGIYNTGVVVDSWIEKTVGITNATTHTITLDDDSLIDPFGNAVSFASVRIFGLLLNSGPGVQVGGGTHILWFGDKSDKLSVFAEVPMLTIGGAAAAVDGSNNTIPILGLGASASNVTYFIGGVAA